jgi:UDPglucose--hexose-1-phosphate uridylyltransferase
LRFNPPSGTLGRTAQARVFSSRADREQEGDRMPEIDKPSLRPNGTHGRLLRDPVTGIWTILATERRTRPRDVGGADDAAASCPFCPGNEALTPPELDALRDPGGRPDRPGWRVRVVPNKYPALPGAHEVIVHSPDHDRDLEELDDNQVAAVIEMYGRRLAAQLERGARAVTIDCNRGPRAGASLQHPHSQLFATPMVPTRQLEELENFTRFRNRYGGCILCEEGARAREERRLVLDGAVSAWVPAAPAWPFGLWLAPVEHTEDLRATDPAAVAEALSAGLAATMAVTDGAPLNFWLHTSPAETTGAFHWHIELAPRLQPLAGFELGTGMAICEVDPAAAAKELRAALRT